MKYLIENFSFSAVSLPLSPPINQIMCGYKSRQTHTILRGVFRTLSNIYDGVVYESNNRVLAFNYFRKKALS